MIKSIIYKILYKIGQVLTLPISADIGQRLGALSDQVDHIESAVASFISTAASSQNTQRACSTRGDPTLIPPPGYSEERGYAVLSEAFRRCFEFLLGSRVAGSILEFGTFRGYSARIIAELMREFNVKSHLHLYDSFIGLPEPSSDMDVRSYEVAVNKVWTKGIMEVDRNLPEHIFKTLGAIINPTQLHLAKGFFSDTLSSNLPLEKAALVHLDCDLYQSAKEVLDCLLQNDLLQDGTVIVIDDYNCNRANPLMGERKAIVDAFAQQSRFIFSPWFAYGWHGQTAFVHDTHAPEIIAPSTQ